MRAKRMHFHSEFYSSNKTKKRPAFARATGGGNLIRQTSKPQWGTVAQENDRRQESNALFSLSQT